MVCVCVCVHNPTPGDSQACNYTLVGVKLIKAGWGERGEERCSVKADNAHPYQTPGFSITPLGFIIILPFFCVIVRDPPTHQRAPLGNIRVAHGTSRLTTIIQLEGRVIADSPDHINHLLDYLVGFKQIIHLDHERGRHNPPKQLHEEPLLFNITYVDGNSDVSLLQESIWAHHKVFALAR